MLTNSSEMFSRVWAMSLLMFYLVNFPKMSILTSLGLAPFDFSTYSKMFSPSLFRPSNNFSMLSLGRRSFKT